MPNFDNDGYNIHRLRCSGPELFRKREERNDGVFVRCQKAKPRQTPGGLNGLIAARLNVLFKLCNLTAGSCSRLAHISLLTIIEGSTPDSPEGMVRIGMPLRNYVVHIAEIEGMAHLTPVNPETLYLVPNRMDVDIWNEIHDRN